MNIFANRETAIAIDWLISDLSSARCKAAKRKIMGKTIPNNVDNLSVTFI